MKRIISRASIAPLFARGSWLVAIWVIFQSCAQMVSPNGGPKDTKPPKVLKYIPDSAALHFNSKQIRILFNEYIQLKSVSTQLIVSPPLKHKPDIKVKGKELLIKLADTLLPNTTYDFNFGAAVADITEGNVLNNFQYIFSTGSFIDSLSMHGTVKDALTLIPVKDVSVMLYADDNDSLPFRKGPSYFAKTSDNGNYIINNIRGGKYKLFALKDANANYLYDSPEESIAFSDSLVGLPLSGSVDLLLFSEGPKKQFIKKSKAPEFGHIQLVFNKPLGNLELTPLNFKPAGADWKIVEYNKTRDSVDLWLPGFKKDSLILTVRDSLQKSDTLEFSIPPRDSKEKKFRLSYRTNGSGMLDISSGIRVAYNHYLDSASLIRDSVFIWMDTSKSVLPLADSALFSQAKRNSKPDFADIRIIERQIIIEPKNKAGWKEDAKYRVLILPGALKDVFGLTCDPIRLDFKIRELKYYGTLKMTIGFPSELKGSLFQLLNSKDDIIRQHVLNDFSPFMLDFLPPAEYHMRVVVDKNKNGKFDAGNYLKHIQPEKVIYNPGKIIIRSNWDLEQDWKIN